MRLEFQGAEKSKIETESEAAKVATPVTDGSYSGVAWFDPELGRMLETISTRDFKVTSNKFVNPAIAQAGTGRTQSMTDDHHQVITERLVSLEGW